MEKLTFKNCAAQGDLMLRRIESLPEGLTKANAENGVYVVAHSETGHNHVIDATTDVSWWKGNDPMISYIEVKAKQDVEVLLRHLRSFDTHKTIIIPNGVFEVRRQREHTPDGWRRVED